MTILHVSVLIYLTGRQSSTLSSLTIMNLRAILRKHIFILIYDMNRLRYLNKILLRLANGQVLTLTFALTLRLYTSPEKHVQLSTCC